jgi:hypothetical protein
MDVSWSNGGKWATCLSSIRLARACSHSNRLPGTLRHFKSCCVSFTNILLLKANDKAKTRVNLGGFKVRYELIGGIAGINPPQF